MRSAVLSLALMAASAVAAPVSKSCDIKKQRHTAVEYVDLTVTQTVYVTDVPVVAAAVPTAYAVPEPDVYVTTIVYVEPPAPSPEPVYAPPPVYAPVEPSPTPAPAPKPKPVPAPVQAPTSDDQKCVDTHNKFRAAHGAPPLTWNQQMADYARDNSVSCVMSHSGGQYGENLAFGYSDVETAITAWYNEKDQYSNSNPSFSSATGHFTQLIWKATTEIGCYNRQCGGQQYLMCEYSTPGNVVGDNGRYFLANVQM